MHGLPAMTRTGWRLHCSPGPKTQFAELLYHKGGIKLWTKCFSTRCGTWMQCISMHEQPENVWRGVQSHSISQLSQLRSVFLPHVSTLGSIEAQNSELILPGFQNSWRWGISRSLAQFHQAGRWSFTVMGEPYQNAIRCDQYKWWRQCIFDISLIIYKFLTHLDTSIWQSPWTLCGAALERT